MLSMENHCRKYIQSKSGCVAKFMPRSDGPFLVTNANPGKLSYMLDLPNKPNHFPTFHSSQLCQFNPNNPELFPLCTLAQLGPVMTRTGEEEWLIKKILDEQIHGRGHQYLVRWCGWGAEEDCWLPGRELEETEALGDWLQWRVA